MSYHNLKVIEAQSARELAESRIKTAEQMKVEWANIEAIRTRPEGSYLLNERFYGANIVTDAGDIYYAQQGANETPTNDFAHATNAKHVLRDNATPLTPAKGNTYTNFTSPIASSIQSHDSTYPRTNDPDANNTATNKTRKVTYRVTYTTANANGTNITGGVITSVASPTTGSPLLTHYAITAFAKTSTDTLTMYVNHETLGS